MAISHLLFADDLILFGEANEKTLQSLTDTLYLFGQASGQTINYSKSTLMLSPNTQPYLVDLFETNLGCKGCSSLGTYLGFDLNHRRPSVYQFRKIVEKVKGKLASWKTKYLSKAGRLTLIKSTLSSMANYQMTCIKLPSSVVNQIEGVARNFLWQKEENKKGMHLVAWEKIRKPLWAGGLGVKNLLLTNKVFLTKLCWNLASFPDNIASKMIASKYFSAGVTLSASKRGLTFGRVLKRPGLHSQQTADGQWGQEKQ